MTYKILGALAGAAGVACVLYAALLVFVPAAWLLGGLGFVHLGRTLVGEGEIQ